jgi:hypothetical protein
MARVGRWISLLPIFAVIPRLGLMVIAADRQAVGPETRAALLWVSSASLAALVGFAEVYVGVAVVSRRHGGLALVWAGITILLNALIIPLSISGLEAMPVWEILGSRALRVAWGSGLGLLSSLCVGGCLWADVVLDSSGLPEAYENHLLTRISDEEAHRSALEAQLSALRAEVERAGSGAPTALPAPARHASCPLCGYWHPQQPKVAGHITQCRRRAAARSDAQAAEAAAGAASTILAPDAPLLG